MPARVQIVVETKDVSSGILRGITGQFGQLGSVVEEMTAKNVNWGNVAQQATTLVIEGLKQSYAAAQEYSQSVRDLSLITQTGAEQTSRFLQVLDDYQLTADDATAASKALKENGLVPTIDTLADLADQYQSIKDPAEKLVFIQENLGRGGAKWINVLNQQSDALRNQAANVDQNLILTDEMIRKMELARLAGDAWADTWQGIQVQVGAAMGSIVADMEDTKTAAAEERRELEDTAKSLGMTVDGFLDYSLALDASGRAQNNLIAQQEKTDWAAQEKGITDTADAAKDLAVSIQEIDYKALIQGIQSTQSEMDNYAKKNQEIAESEQVSIAKKAELLASIEKLKSQGYQEAGQTIQDVRENIKAVDAELENNKKTLAENEAAHKKWAAQTIFAFAQARAAADGSITEGEGKVLIEMGQQLGLFDEQTAKAMEGVNKAFENVDTENAEESITAVKSALEALTGQPWTVFVQGVYSVTGSTSVGTNCFIENTKILMRDYVFKNIQDVEPGDYVISYEVETGMLKEAKVAEKITHDKSEVKDGYLLINYHLGVTREHPLKTPDGWKYAGDLNAGDTLITPEGTIKVFSILEIKDNVTVYNLHIDDEDHNFFANGILVHNVIPKAAQGGQVYAGKPTLVGEAGQEVFVPPSNGRILSNAESLHAMTIANGGGGGSNYFYGNVTLQIGDDDASGLMSVR